MNRALFSILAGVGGMFGWGTSDFLAKLGTDKVGTFRTFFWSQIAGAVFIAIFLPFLAGSLLPLSIGLFSVIILCGVIYGIGYLFFYAGFEKGNASVVSAVINSQVVLTVSIAYFIRGQHLTTFQIPALIFILLGVTFVSVNFAELHRGTVSLMKGVKETLVAVFMFGALYWPMNEYVVEQVDWVWVSFLNKIVALITVFLIGRLTQQALSFPKSVKISQRMIVLIVSIGVLEAAAILSVSLGMAYGDGIIVAPIYSTLTIVTASLAYIFLKERLSRLQIAGILLTVGGIVLMAF